MAEATTPLHPYSLCCPWQAQPWHADISRLSNLTSAFRERSIGCEQSLRLMVAVRTGLGKRENYAKNVIFPARNHVFIMSCDVIIMSCPTSSGQKLKFEFSCHYIVGRCSSFWSANLSFIHWSAPATCLQI